MSVGPREELREMLDEISARVELIVEQRRARDIAAGLNPNRPEMTVEQMQVAAVRLRAENDQADAERRDCR